MPRAKPVVLNTRYFDSKKDATTFFKDMLNRYRPKQRVSEEDASHLAALLKRHSEYQGKVFIGIDHFEVMGADFGTQCFRIVRTDGTDDDFSYRHCIDGSRLVNE